MTGSGALSDKSTDSGLYLVRYQSTQARQETQESYRQLLEVNRELGLSWIRSYESDDGTEIFSVYEAPDTVALKDQALCLGLHISELIHVAETLPPVRRPRRQRDDRTE